MACIDLCRNFTLIIESPSLIVKGSKGLLYRPNFGGSNKASLTVIALTLSATSADL